MTRCSTLLLVAACLLGPRSAVADEYHITEPERAACTADAIRLCYSAYPDERVLLNCMKQNMSSLSVGCAAAFKAGLKKRGLPR